MVSRFPLGVLAAALLPPTLVACEPNEVSTCGTLPSEVWETISAVEEGGPYPYAEDDTHFGNYEAVLPDEEPGYYREYTVDTPGLNHRGARRIVTGGGDDGIVDEWYYTADHYESFCEVNPPEKPSEAP